MKHVNVDERVREIQLTDELFCHVAIVMSRVLCHTHTFVCVSSFYKRALCKELAAAGLNGSIEQMVSQCPVCFNDASVWSAGPMRFACD